MRGYGLAMEHAYLREVAMEQDSQERDYDSPLQIPDEFAAKMEPIRWGNTRRFKGLHRIKYGFYGSKIQLFEFWEGFFQFWQFIYPNSFEW